MDDARKWHLRITKHGIFEHLSSADVYADKRASLLAVRNAEVFLATKDRVRYTDASSMDNYIELDIDGIDFEILSITLNRTRSLLVVAGAHRVLAIFLPRALRQLQRRLKAYEVGDYAKHTIKQVEIHPYCAADTSVVILSSDGYLKLYEFNISFEHAELVVDLLGQATRKYQSSYSLGDTQDTLPMRFCFGTGGDGWTSFTVFLLLENGDVYTICPVLPRTCLITEEHASAFTTYVIDEGERLSGSAAKIVHAIDRGDRDQFGTTFLRPARLPSPIVLGPLLLSPAPLEFSKVQIAATGLCFLPSQPLNILAIGFDGKVDVCVMAQCIKSSLEVAPQLTVHESIVLAGVLGPNLSQNVLSPTNSSFFIVHNNGIHEVETKHWLDDICQSFESQNDEQVRDAAKEDISSEIGVLLDSQKLGLLGFAIIENELESFLLGLSFDMSVHLMTLGDSSDLFPSDDVDSNGLETITNSDSLIKYQSLLSTPAYRPQSLTRGPKIVVPPGISHKKIKSDVETLQFMAKFVLQARKELEELMSAYIAMHRRLALQNREFERQNKKFGSINTSQEHLNTSLTDRVDKARSRQESLERRLARISQELIDNHSPGLSDAEKRYFQELDRVRTSLAGARGLIARTAIARNQYKQLQSLLSTGDAGPEAADERARASVESPLRTTQLTSIKERIQCNEEILSKTRGKVERLSRLAATS